MAFLRVREILKQADERKTSVIAFNCIDYSTIYSVIAVAEELNKPAICMLYPEHAYGKNVINLAGFASAVKSLAEKVSVPIGVHLDHSSDYAFIIDAIKSGFTSVMYDGAMLPLEENIANTRKVVETAHLLGADVEAELGYIGLAENGLDTDAYTQPEIAARFVNETGVDSLAIAIGSAHGIYASTPHLDLQRLDEINAATEAFLVLHGGTGIPEDQLESAFTRGINKLNVGTEYLRLWKASMAKYTMDETCLPEEAPGKVQEQLMNYLRKKMQLTKM